jgi:hypothetical protein
MTHPATLSPKQRAALLWLWPSSERSWNGTACGDPSVTTLTSLVRRGMVTPLAAAPLPRYRLTVHGMAMRVAASASHKPETT